MTNETLLAVARNFEIFWQNFFYWRLWNVSQDITASSEQADYISRERWANNISGISDVKRENEEERFKTVPKLAGKRSKIKIYTSLT